MALVHDSRCGNDAGFVAIVVKHPKVYTHHLHMVSVVFAEVEIYALPSRK